MTSVMEIVSTKKKKTIATNVTSTAPINCYSEKLRDFISNHITIGNYYLLSLSKAKNH